MKRLILIKEQKRGIHIISIRNHTILCYSASFLSWTSNYHLNTIIQKKKTKLWIRCECIRTIKLSMKCELRRWRLRETVGGAEEMTGRILPPRFTLTWTHNILFIDVTANKEKKTHPKQKPSPSTFLWFCVFCAAAASDSIPTLFISNLLMQLLPSLL